MERNIVVVTDGNLDADDPLFRYEPDGTTDEEVSAADADDYLYGTDGGKPVR